MLRKWYKPGSIMKGISRTVISYPASDTEFDIYNQYSVDIGKNKNIFKKEKGGIIYELDIDKYLFYASRIHDDGKCPAIKQLSFFDKNIMRKGPVYENFIEIYISRYFIFR